MQSLGYDRSSAGSSIPACFRGVAHTFFHHKKQTNIRIENSEEELCGLQEEQLWLSIPEAVVTIRGTNETSSQSARSVFR